MRLAPRPATYRLHEVLERVETNVTSCRLDLGIHGHGDTLTGCREHKRPLSTDEGELNGEQGDDCTKDTREVDIDVFTIGGGDGSLTGGDCVAEEDDGEELAGKIERPVVALHRPISMDRVGKKVDTPCMPEREG